MTNPPFGDDIRFYPGPPTRCFWVYISAHLYHPSWFIQSGPVRSFNAFHNLRAAANSFVGVRPLPPCPYRILLFLVNQLRIVISRQVLPNGLFSSESRYVSLTYPEWTEASSMFRIFLFPPLISLSIHWPPSYCSFLHVYFCRLHSLSGQYRTLAAGNGLASSPGDPNTRTQRAIYD